MHWQRKRCSERECTAPNLNAGNDVNHSFEEWGGSKGSGVEREKKRGAVMKRGKEKRIWEQSGVAGFALTSQIVGRDGDLDVQAGAEE